MTVKYNSSSDRARAQQLATKLGERSIKRQQLLPRRRTQLNTPELDSGVAAMVPAPKTSFGEPGVYREDVWNELLAWVCEVFQAEVAFVADMERGLLIASRGDDNSELLEAKASHLAHVMGQLARVAEDESMPERVATSFLGHSITAVNLTENEPLMLGIASDNHDLDPELLSRVQAEIRGRMANP